MTIAPTSPGASSTPLATTPSERRRGLGTRRETAVLAVVIVALGAALRLVALADSPAGLWYDEALNGENARSILAGERPIFFYPDGYPQEPLFFYLQAAALKVFAGGRPAVWPLRATSAAVGIATLAAFWLFARTMLPRRWALVALFVMAVLPWHVHFSRLGFRTILAPLFVCLIGWAQARWLRTGRLGSAALLGALAGAALYTYTAANILPVAAGASLVVAVIWCHGVFAGREGPAEATEAAATRRRAVVGLAVAALAFAVVFAPLAIYYVQHGERVLDRARQVGPGAGTFTLGENAQSLLFFFVGLASDGVFKHGPLGRPAFELFFAGFFVAGGAWTAWRARSRRGLGLYAWLALLGFVAASLLSESAPNRLRMLGATPVVALFFAQGLRLATLGLRALAVPRGVARFAVGVALAMWMWSEASPIVLDWHRNPAIYMQFSGPFTQAGRWARGEALPGPNAESSVRRFDVPLHLPSAVANHATVRFLTQDAPNVHALDSLEAALVAGPGEPMTAYLLVTSNAPNNYAILEELGARPQPVALLANPVSGEPWGAFVLVARRTNPLDAAELKTAEGYLSDR